jgi:MerR family transcriptional regulator, redox-sensitive transcriptional activator SoxR
VRSVDLIPIGEMAARSGVAPSALRFYESMGLIEAERSAGNQRMYRRHQLRRVAFIRVAQRLGLSLHDVSDALATLPTGRAPTKAQWAKLSRSWRARLDERIARLESLRDDLTGCIGCGCLSLRQCRLYNPDDVASERGESARYLLGDDPDDVVPVLGEARNGVA